MNEEFHDYWAGKIVVVTGSARGQGAALTRKLLSGGAKVYAIDLIGPDDPAWTPLRDPFPGRLVVWAQDVSAEDGWKSLVRALDDAGECPVALVNNAGITGARHTVTKTELEDWERVLAVNLTGAMLGMRAIAPRMPRGGSIVNISSTVGMTGYHSAAYSTSKWGLRGLTRSAALELAPRGVRVNSVCPGVVDTELIHTNQALVQALQSVIPMGSMAQPEQIAEVVLFLLGPSASYVTGADFAVDGGITGGGIYWPVGRELGVFGAREKGSRIFN